MLMGEEDIQNLFIDHKIFKKNVLSVLNGSPIDRY